MYLLESLLSRPAELPKSSRYVTWNGVLYLAAGMFSLLLPQISQSINMDPPLVGNDEAYARLTGFLLAVVGWLYVFGGRSGGGRFVAAPSSIVFCSFPCRSFCSLMPELSRTL